MYPELLREAHDPEVATRRFEQLCEHSIIRDHLPRFSREELSTFIRLISISDFLFRYLHRQPEKITCLPDNGTPGEIDPGAIVDASELREYKYQELLKIAWQDIAARSPYETVLHRLSALARKIIGVSLELTGKQTGSDMSSFCVFAMGKLGADELNFSSDIDLIFVAREFPENTADVHELQSGIYNHIRRFNQLMQQQDENGMLYRVDLNLRPLGRSGPLALSIDETEHYYEASTEAWERFAWLRAQVIAGNLELGRELLERIQPFIYLRSLSSDDLRRFVEIKQMMARQRKRDGNWNVKLGEGGIRDIEFFIQMLQLVNADSHPVLKVTHTLSVLQSLVDTGYIDAAEGQVIRDSYLFLRRLENHLQMIDEQQTHQLPDDRTARNRIAASMGYSIVSSDTTSENFDEKLMLSREVAMRCFNKILPDRE